MRLRVNTVLLRHLLLLFSEISSLIRVGPLWTHTNLKALALETLAVKRVCRTLLQVRLIFGSYFLKRFYIEGCK